MKTMSSMCFVGVLLMSLTLCSSGNNVDEGKCFHNGQQFSENSIWQLDPCTMCSCEDSVPVCSQVKCQSLNCNYTSDSALEFLPNQCCPTCMKRHPCLNNGQWIQHGTEWSEDLCTHCQCLNSEIHCSRRACNIKCSDSKLVQTGTSCCPRCVNIGRICTENGLQYKNGMFWNPYPCVAHFCNNGFVEEYIIECPHVACKENEKREILEGDCCPQCVSPSCVVNGNVHKSGSTWIEDACNTCTCINGRVKCHSKDCPNKVSCKNGEVLMLLEGECCPQCIVGKDLCKYGDKIYPDGSIWNITACEFCMCNQGEVKCQKASCTPVVCKNDESYVHLPDQCCAQCIANRGSCNIGYTTRNDGEFWKEGSKLCMCQHNTVQCFEPSCSDGTSKISSSLLPFCLKRYQTTCSENCEVCDSHNPTRCIKCKNKLVENGVCVKQCSAGYYEKYGICRKCHWSCATCSGKSQFQCLSCAHGLFVKEDECVPTCGSSYYSESDRCLPCHSSCLSCSGQEDTQCTRCKNGGVLENGKCVELCQEGYAVSGVCQSCPDNCKFCSKNGCIVCEKNFILQNFQCVSTCTSGFFLNQDGICAECHKDCKQCQGYGPMNCTKCNEFHLLLQNSCLNKCPSGYYAENGTCHRCHSSCRICIGPSMFHCTTCSQHRKILQKNKFEDTGKCISSCPTGYFETADGICRVCGTHCTYCSGPNSCTTCDFPYVSNGSSCVLECTSGYYMDTKRNKCKICHSSCYTCFGGQPDQCLSCPVLTVLKNGRCESPCKRNEYLNGFGHCSACHDSCDKCYLKENKPVCTKCKVEQDYIRNEKCLQICGVGYFHSEENRCIKCDKSCFSCMKGGPFGCTLCPYEKVLTHVGSCEEKCSMGFYAVNGICHACGANCAECSKESECLTCDGKNKIAFLGECVDKCPETYYLDLGSMTCKECSWTCNTCSGSAESDCLTCMPELFLQDSHCVTSCSAGYYLNGKRCTKCPYGCETCKANTCFVCNPGLFLRDNNCVETCGQGMYEDKKSFLCKECPHNCLSCTIKRCNWCKSPYFLQDGKCTLKCSKTFKKNLLKMSCVANRRSPILTVHEVIRGEIHSDIILQSSVATVSDDDSDIYELHFILLEPPSIGNLVKVYSRTETVLLTNGTFTVTDLQQGRLFFSHHAKSSSVGSFKLKASDGQFDSKEEICFIQLNSLLAPQITVRGPLIVQKGRSAYLNEMIHIHDVDNSYEVYITVLEAPKYGTLNFSMEDDVKISLETFNSQKIIYQHDESAIKDDVIIFQISDNTNVKILSLKILVIPPVEYELKLVRNNDVQVQLGHEIPILPENLLSTSMNASDKDIIYTIFQTPKGGAVYVQGDITYSDASFQGELPQADSVQQNKYMRFTQKDINEGRVWYKHAGLQLQPDHLTFSVMEQKPPFTILPQQSLDIEVVSSDEASYALTSGSNLTLTVMAGQPVTISVHHLSYVDSTLTANEVVYQLRQTLPADGGHLLLLDHPGVEVHSFTQADVNNMNLIYLPPNPDAMNNEHNFNFSFTIKRKTDNYELDKEKIFHIRVLPLGQLEPEFKIPYPEIIVNQGSAVNISRKYFEVTGLSSDDFELRYVITEIPMYGSLHIYFYNGSVLNLNGGSEFVFQDLENGVVGYHHNVLDMHEDLLEVFATDGRLEAVNRIMLLIKNTSNEPLSLKHFEIPSLIVKEGEEVYIEINHLEMDINQDDVKFQLVQEPHFGSLILKQDVNSKTKLGNGSVISRNQINQRKVYFVSKPEIGSDPVLDKLTFHMMAEHGQVISEQSITITINPVDNQIPIVTVNGELVVIEGDTEVLPAELLSIHDPDSSLQNIHIIIDSPPLFGYLTLDEDGGDESLTAFNVVSLQEEEIRYIQSQHHNIEPTEDAILFHVSDGKNNSPITRLNISIELVNDEPPVIITEVLHVEKGKGTVIRNASLYVGDFDSEPDDLILTVLQSPYHGIIKRRESVDHPVGTGHIISVGQTVTYENILEELVTYSPTAFDVHDDLAIFSVTDGDFSTQGRLPIMIGTEDSETPRIKINRGLNVPMGETRMITSSVLLAVDIDSPENLLKYVIVRTPSNGHVQLLKYVFPDEQEWSNLQDGDFFYQEDINEGNVRYVHAKDGVSGMFPMRFYIEDDAGNQLLDQAFIISVSEDIDPPHIVRNEGLVLKENALAVISSQLLSSTDSDSEPMKLTYMLKIPPREGILKLVDGDKHDSSVILWTQADIEAGRLVYFHNSEKEAYADEFTFSVSDGANTVSQTFHITVLPVDDQLPTMEVHKVQVQEGMRKMISEFDLRATDLDTSDSMLYFSIISPPKHGKFELLIGKSYLPTEGFTMLNIYEGQVFYHHDGSNTLKDECLLSLSDSTNPQYKRLGDETPITAPTVLYFEILPVDDGTPIISYNNGLQVLEYIDGKARGVISNRDLRTDDLDTTPNNIIYTVTQQPAYGYLYLASAPEIQVSIFSQEDINRGYLYYQLNTVNTSIAFDVFEFEVADSKPNIVPHNQFHIQWSWIYLEKEIYEVSESDDILKIKVIRAGNVKNYCIVFCSTNPISATFGTSKQPGDEDFLQLNQQVQFDEFETVQFCSVTIRDDLVYEGPELFAVELFEPNQALLGFPSSSTITIYDKEDQPEVAFKSSKYFINETDRYIYADIVRSGDTSIPISVICYTKSGSASGSGHMLETGADFISRPQSVKSLVTMHSGVTEVTCRVQIIDDSLYEMTEEFYMLLSDVNPNAKLGNITKTTVYISGPSDISIIHFSEAEYRFSENGGTVSLEVIREGMDLSEQASVWCSTKMSERVSATSGIDYLPNSAQIIFYPEETKAFCYLTILDDNADVILEGPETLQMFLNTPHNAILSHPSSANIIIDDLDNDTPILQFGLSQVVVFENSTKIKIPVNRSGDLSDILSVKCFTRQRSAKAGEDFVERPKAEISTIIFAKGAKTSECEVVIMDDHILEGDEEFVLKLTDPVGVESNKVYLGNKATVKIKIQDQEDIPRIGFERDTYSIMEPNSSESTAKLLVKVNRMGDTSREAKVRVSTRDGSASSGSDYHPVSQIISFKAGVKSVPFEVMIIHNKGREWHETFSIILGPDDPTNAQLGRTSTATVTILDHEVTGSIVLPSEPIVVSLLYLDSVNEGVLNDPSPGYPLVCVTPCDEKYPHFQKTGEMCRTAEINEDCINYSWEVAIPSGIPGFNLPFKQIKSSTVFASATSKVLDSSFFARRFQVRCIAQPVQENGQLGIPIRSAPVTIGTQNGICQNSIIAGYPDGFQSQSFVASLKYCNVTDEKHPNSLQVHIEIPHQDGMIPLISMHQLRNLNLVLTDSIYRSQHICSNLQLGKSFLSSHPQIQRAGISRPYQLDTLIRGNNTINLYHHLDLKSCLWVFDAWYHPSALVDHCGGRIIEEFQVVDKGQSFLTVQVPLYVSYVYASAPMSWTAMEHHTEMEFSFYYSSLLWHKGLETDSVLSGRLQITRIAIDDNGHLIVNFKTTSQFRGCYVLRHHTLQKYKSQVVAPSHLKINFTLELLWSQSTWDGPEQKWRAKSLYNLKDYTGEYTFLLIPCTVQPIQSYEYTETPVCTAHAPTPFKVPIAFQQTSRPVPVVYSLDTDFLLTNNPKLFLADPSGREHLQELDYKGSFTQADIVYGRVLWDPSQDLNSAYELQIERLYLCTGRDGYVPTYDPTGEIYREGPQYGCIQNSPRLKHQFLLLDRNQPQNVDKEYNSIPFEAYFAMELPDFEQMSVFPGVDGFLLKVDALYKINSGYRWYLQVLYTIGSSSKRPRRSAISSVGKLLDEDSVKMNMHNGTNMKGLSLIMPAIDESSFDFPSYIMLLVILTLCMILTIVSVFFCHRRYQNKTLICCNRESSNKLKQSEMQSQLKPLNSQLQRKTVHVRAVAVTVRNNLDYGTEV